MDPVTGGSAASPTASTRGHPATTRMPQLKPLVYQAEAMSRSSARWPCAAAKIQRHRQHPHRDAPGDEGDHDEHGNSPATVRWRRPQHHDDTRRDAARKPIADTAGQQQAADAGNAVYQQQHTQQRGVYPDGIDQDRSDVQVYVVYWAIMMTAVTLQINSTGTMVRSARSGSGI